MNNKGFLELGTKHIPITYSSAEELDARIVELSALFIATFSTPPRNEAWTGQQASDFILRHFLVGGWCSCILGAKKEVLAFSLQVPWENWRLIVGAIDVESATAPILYLSTIATAIKSRNRGCASSLLISDGQKAKASGYNCIVARARADVPEVNGLLKKVGFVGFGKHFGSMGGVAAERVLYLKLI
ncbi:hypothetical protein [Verrucomicrobium sp. GAS474]|uniref:hypothetical protein n=1 Tax=Verrucomicrobium sp. GAS474 TaxID=1882831 RepID=UPI000B86C9B1|nr:hypothetical protein [Verrucomicrobium sp. GAS474]